MKQIIVSALLLISIITFSQKEKKTDLSSFNQKKINWHNKDYKKDKIVGSSVERLYKEFLNNKKPKKTIIVAVIDGGIDIYHKDFKNRIWINKNEIPNNGIDDDKNGYIDDVNGWNFIGNKEGKHLNETTLEKTRLFGALDEKYADFTKNDINDENKKEYLLYLKVKESFNKEYQEALNESNSLKNYIKNIEFAEEYVRKYLNREEVTVSGLNNIKTDNTDVKEIVGFLKSVYASGGDIKYFKKYLKRVENELKYSLNIDFNPRKNIIGDDCNNYEEIGYGNNDVKGPRSSHGTFGAGIIAAVRNNSYGIDGVADSVKIMTLRVVPDGDEYDKDVALSIRYAVDNGANIINMSFGKEFSVNPQKVWEAAKYASNHNVLLVHAAGNEAENNDETVHYPIDYLENTDTIENFITVGASDMKRNKHLPADFSNYGKTTVDLFAPGYELVSTAPENTFSLASGTSFSTPLVSGVAALIWSYFPELTATELKQALMQNVSPFGKRKVFLPQENYEKKQKVRFRELSVTGGVINAYNVYIELKKL